MKDIIFKVFLVIQGFILLFILYKFALNNRYFFIVNSPIEVDKWTNTIIKPKGYEKLESDSTAQEQIENQVETNEPEEADSSEQEEDASELNF